ncbi:MAG TPA: DsbA family protein [Micropepsaceae bacterium]|nr:DsbA family protein [Micropepsaceae bacterium]
MNKNTLIYGAIAVVVVAGASWSFGASWWSGLFGGSPLAGLAATTQSVEIKPTDMVHGKADAKVTIIEYASMTCPHCAAFQKEVIPLLTKDYIDTGKVKLIFREYPLDGAARLASAVARCFSGDQYFSFIDLLFANQMNWIKDFDGNGQLTKEDIQHGLADMGRQAGMPQEKVNSCGDDPMNLALVDANWQEGMSRYGVDSTPTFIINGVKHSGEIPYDQLKMILDPLVAK